MADLRGAWNETGEKLTELGRKLKVHYDEQRDEPDGEQSRRELNDAARKVGGALHDAFDAMGAAARDKSVQSDVRQVGQSLVEALGATLGQASDELRRAFSERKGTAGAAGSAGSAGAAGTTHAPGEVPASGAPGTAAEDAGVAGGEEPPGKGPGKVEPWGTP